MISPKELITEVIGIRKLKLGISEEKLLSVICEFKEGGTLAQIATTAEWKYIERWEEGRVLKILKKLIDRGAVMDVRRGDEIFYSSRVAKDEFELSILARIGKRYFDDYIFCPALAPQEEITEEEWEKLKALLEELDDDE